MARLKVSLVSSRPLLLSDQVLEALTKVLQEHEIEIVRMKQDIAMQLKIRFVHRKKSIEQEIDEFQQRIRKSEESDEPIARSKIMMFKTIMKALRAELKVARKNFLLSIIGDQVVIETVSEIPSPLSYVYFQMYFERIVCIIGEAYAKMGEKITLTLTKKDGTSVIY